jgi:predicted MFS family arabinose efflux permease
MQKLNGNKIVKTKTSFKDNFVFRNEYKLYYMLAALYGARKQIMYVYGPWVLIELMGFGADTMSLLVIAGAGIGIFFIPAVGRWIDRFGVFRIIFTEEFIFIFIYIAYGIMSAALDGGAAAAGMVVALAFVINIADRMTMQFGMVRTIYMRSIAIKKEDVTPTLSTGMALDHILSISSAFLCGLIWREFGPQYVFVFALLLCAGNMVVAMLIKKSGEGKNSEV